jgi:hypothetical protein
VHVNKHCQAECLAALELEPVLHDRWRSKGAV